MGRNGVRPRRDPSRCQGGGRLAHLTRPYSQVQAAQSALVNAGAVLEACVLMCKQKCSTQSASPLGSCWCLRFTKHLDLRDWASTALADASDDFLHAQV